MKIIDIDVKHILLLTVYKLFYVIDILCWWYHCSSIAT